MARGGNSPTAGALAATCLCTDTLAGGGHALSTLPPLSPPLHACPAVLPAWHRALARGVAPAPGWFPGTDQRYPPEGRGETRGRRPCLRWRAGQRRQGAGGSRRCLWRGDPGAETGEGRPPAPAGHSAGIPHCRGGRGVATGGRGGGGDCSGPAMCRMPPSKDAPAPSACRAVQQRGVRAGPARDQRAGPWLEREEAEGWPMGPAGVRSRLDLQDPAPSCVSVGGAVRQRPGVQEEGGGGGAERLEGRTREMRMVGGRRDLPVSGVRRRAGVGTPSAFQARRSTRSQSL